MKIQIYTTILLFIACFASHMQAQPNYTANDKVTEYNNTFLYGIGGGLYTGWSDEQQADIAAGAPAKQVPGIGAATLRVALFEHFLTYWGYNIRTNAFAYYESLGIKDNACIIGYPIDGTDKKIFHREKKSYCENRSLLFENMYTDIWDGGANGTPVNDNNYYALYIYKMVNAYKGKVKFWEVWNEPDYSSKGSLAKGQAGNWWENNPSPCDMININAPVFNYNRLLRISYEVIKSIDPTSYVCIGGIGYPSFLDAVLRNTDNPDNGKVVANTYPLKGGAYFDVLDYHSYPHIESGMRAWDNGIGGFKYSRHTDQAIKAISKKKDDLTTVLKTYGYGTTYPQKVWIITESNIPRKMTGQDFGGEEAQRNYVIKGAILSQKIGISQWYIYQVGDRKNAAEVTNMDGEFAVMGLYNNLNVTKPFNQVINNTGIAHKTMSDALLGKRIDLAKTAAMNLGDKIDGAAFLKDGKYSYVLWAKTSVDKSEVASATYTFPASFNMSSVEKRNWDYSKTKSKSNISTTNIALTGAPIFLIDNSTVGIDLADENSNIQEVSCFPNPAIDALSVRFNQKVAESVAIDLYNNNGVKIKTLLPSTFLPNGIHELALNIADLDNGIYQLKIQSGSAFITRKISVLK